MQAVKCVVVMVMVAMALGDNLETTLFKKKLQDDVIFTEKLLFETQARSKVECSRLCASYQGCLTFTFTKGSRACRGHALIVTSSTPVTSMPGTKAYADTTDCASSPCQNGATCNHVETSYTCSCPTGFTGHSCETNMDDCVSNPCKNGGTCRDGINTFTCDCQPPADGGGWTVFQRRKDGGVNFYRPWIDYQQAFGNPAGEFWLGLEALHSLTSNGNELRIDLQKWDCTSGYATYSDFKISNSSLNYRLDFSSFTGGNAGDSLFYHNGQQFTTYDADHDLGSNENCAQSFHGAWWYNDCLMSNPNGDYITGSNATDAFAGVLWITFGGYTSLKFTEMKTRPMP